MQVDLVRVSRTDGRVRYVTDTTMPKSTADAIWLKLGQSAAFTVQGERISLDGEMLSTDNLRSGQNFKHENIVYVIVTKTSDLAMIWRYGFQQVEDEREP